MSNDRYADFRAGMRRKDADPTMSGLKKEPQNNFKVWDNWDNPSSQPSERQRVDQEQREQDLLVARSVRRYF